MIRAPEFLSSSDIQRTVEAFRGDDDVKIEPPKFLISMKNFLTRLTGDIKDNNVITRIVDRLRTPFR